MLWVRMMPKKYFVKLSISKVINIWAIGPNKPSEQTPGDGDPTLYKHLDMNKLIYVPSLVKANFLPSENMNIFAMLTFLFPHKNSRPLIRSLFSLETKHFPHSSLGCRSEWRVVRWEGGLIQQFRLIGSNITKASIYTSLS